VAGNNAGMIAQLMTDGGDSTTAGNTVSCEECLVSLPCSGVTIFWFKRPAAVAPLIISFRVFRERRAYEPNANDLSALSKIGHFEFGLESVEIPFYKCAESDKEDALTYQDELRIA
jgi:hypothetical protein